MLKRGRSSGSRSLQSAASDLSSQCPLLSKKKEFWRSHDHNRNRYSRSFRVGGTGDWGELNHRLSHCEPQEINLPALPAPPGAPLFRGTPFLAVRPRDYGLAFHKANSVSTAWTAAGEWLDHELDLNDASGFTRRQCTTMRKLRRPSGGSNIHVLGPFPSHSEYRTRSLIVVCSIIYRFARYLIPFVLLRDRRMSDSNAKPCAEGTSDDSETAGSPVADSESSGFTFITARVMSSH